MTTSTAKNPYANAKPATKPSLSSLKASFDKIKSSTLETIASLSGAGDETSAQAARTKLQPAIENTPVMETLLLKEDKSSNNDGLKETFATFQCLIVGAEEFLSQDKPSLKDALSALEGTAAAFAKMDEMMLGSLSEESSSGKDNDATAEKAIADTKAADSSPTKKRNADESAAADDERSPKRHSPNKDENPQDEEEKKEEEESAPAASDKKEKEDPVAADPAVVEEGKVIPAPEKDDSPPVATTKDPVAKDGDAKGTDDAAADPAAVVEEDKKIIPAPEKKDDAPPAVTTTTTKDQEVAKEPKEDTGDAAKEGTAPVANDAATANAENIAPSTTTEAVSVSA
mmetsp:Transcript_27570/g.67046  ORF Transcript_27570/g.67046 Transcript_27570/m.67046 type:complete len:343 (-) Transcript_27570:234-1262(-)